MKVVVPLLLALLALAPAAHGQALPDQDPFYAEPPKIAQLPNGSVLKQRAVTVPIPDVTAMQLQFRSTDARGVPIAPVTTVLEPARPYGDGARPLISYQAAYDGLAPQCQPSYALQAGTLPEPELLEALLDRGFLVAVPDYEGLRNAWLAGPLAGHIVLDGLRAAARPGTPLGLFGHSGGGQATAWAAEQHAVYAPDLQVAGAAAGGFTSDPEQLIRFVDGRPAAGTAYAALVGMDRQFPQMFLRSLLNDRGRALVAAVAAKCGEDIARDHPGERLLDNLADPTLADLLRPRVQRVFEVNRLGKQPPDVPAYLFHAIDDERLPVAGVDALTTRWCADGATVYYDRLPNADHAAAALTGTPPAIEFLADRLAGEPAPNNCGTAPAAPIAHYCPGGATTKFRLRRIEGEKVRHVIVEMDGIRVAARRGRALRRIVLRRLVPGIYQFSVLRITENYERRTNERREVRCKQRAI